MASDTLGCSAQETEGTLLKHLVDELRVARQAGRSEGRFEALPSKRVMEALFDQFRAILFPTVFGDEALPEATVDYFVGQRLAAALQELRAQVSRARHFSGHDPCPTRTAATVQSFAGQLPGIRRLLERDIEAAYAGDPAARSTDEVLLCYPGVTAITAHRLAHCLWNLDVPLLPRLLSELAHSRTGIDIHPGARIGESFFIDHGTGVVIGETTRIGARVRLYQGVTLGAKNLTADATGHVTRQAERHPILEDDVVVYAGATILGRVTIGRASTIGGNVWLTRSVPPNSRVSQAQARSEVFDEGAGI